MSFLISVLTGFKFLDRRTDDDLVDRLHYSLTTNVLIGLSILVSWKQFGGKPIECMPPDMYPSSWEQYVENYCWAQDTYHVPADQDLGLDHDTYKKRGKVSYYKWVPLYLLFSAMSFQLPYYIWKMLSHRSGIMLIHMIHLASDPKNVMPDIRPTIVRLLSTYVQNAMRFQKRLTNFKHFRTKSRRVLPLKSQFYLTAIYLTIKVCYLLNVMINFFMMNYMLNLSVVYESGRGQHAPNRSSLMMNDNQRSTIFDSAIMNDYDYQQRSANFNQRKEPATTSRNESFIHKTYQLYGWHVFQEILLGSDAENSGFFPRVTVCDFKARVMGYIQQHSVQCVLVINIFNEKIFIFLWFWYHLLAVVSLLSIFYWTTVSVWPCCRRWFIVRHLELADVPFDHKEEAAKVEKFVFDYLKIDGVFVLRMINNHTGAIFTSDLTADLWKNCGKIEQKLEELTKAASRTRWPSLEKKGGLGRTSPNMARDDIEIFYKVPGKDDASKNKSTTSDKNESRPEETTRKSSNLLEAMLLSKPRKKSTNMLQPDDEEQEIMLDESNKKNS